MSRLKSGKGNKSISTYNLGKKKNMLLLLGEILYHFSGKHSVFQYKKYKTKNIVSPLNWTFWVLICDECRFDKLIYLAVFNLGRSFRFCACSRFFRCLTYYSSYDWARDFYLTLSSLHHSSRHSAVSLFTIFYPLKPKYFLFIHPCSPPSHLFCFCFFPWTPIRFYGCLEGGQYLWNGRDSEGFRLYSQVSSTGWHLSSSSLLSVSPWDGG